MVLQKQWTLDHARPLGVGVSKDEGVSRSFANHVVEATSGDFPERQWGAAHAFRERLAKYLPGDGGPDFVESDFLQGFPSASGPPSGPSTDWPTPPSFA